MVQKYGSVAELFSLEWRDFNWKKSKSAYRGA